MKLPAIKANLLQGSESLHSSEGAVDVQLRDYWSWAYSDLLSNTARGIFAEFLVASSLGISDGVRREWDPVDLISPSGTRVEVKSSAYIQSWHQEKYSRISFDIAPKLAWDEQRNEYADEPHRNSDVYVFCLLAEKDQQKIDPLNLDQWRFYILSTSILDEQLGSQESIALSRLLQLQPLEVPYLQIAEAIEKCHLLNKKSQRSVSSRLDRSKRVHHKIDEVYALFQQLPRFNHLTPKSKLPNNGVYVFFEKGEMIDWRQKQVPRIVRVGTHNKDGRFPTRIRQHYGRVNSLRGNKNGSVFRKHVGGALLRMSDEQDPRLGPWLGQNGGSFPEVEEEVSRTLRESFTFSCFRVDEAADRLALERGLIALLAQHSPWRPSRDWLGLYAANEKIREYGLWNVQRTTSQPISTNELLQLTQLIEVTLDS